MEHEGRKVGPAEGVTADEVPQARAEELPVRDRLVDRGRGLAVHLGHAQECGDLGLRQVPRGAEAAEESLDDRIGCLLGTGLRSASDGVAEGVPQGGEIGEANDVDDRG